MILSNSMPSTNEQPTDEHETTLILSVRFITPQLEIEFEIAVQRNSINSNQDVLVFYIYFNMNKGSF